jgi:hypothetical protein
MQFLVQTEDISINSNILMVFVKENGVFGWEGTEHFSAV